MRYAMMSIIGRIRMLGRTRGVAMNLTTAVTISASILIAIAGYVATYANTLRLTRRADQLNRINRQLSELYGPLLATANSSTRAFVAFCSIHIPRYGNWRDQRGEFASRAAEENWELWARSVFVPLNDRMRELVLAKADLIVDDTLPPVLLDLLEHTETYHGVVAQWDHHDYSRHWSTLSFPKDLLAYAETNFTQLKKAQGQLLAAPGKTSRRASATALSS